MHWLYITSQIRYLRNVAYIQVSGKDKSKLPATRSPQGLYNWAACDVTNPILSPLLSLSFQVISGTPQIFKLLNPRDKKRYYATQYFNFSVTLLRYGLKILTDSWIEGDSLGYPDHPPRRCHPECQPTFIHFFTNTLKCWHGRLAGRQGQPLTPVTLLHAQRSYS